MDHTFVIPAFQSPPFIEECLLSLRAQRPGGGVVLITTSTPTTNLSQIAHRHECKVLTSERRSGIGTDWNFALASAGGQLVTLAHQDDLYHPDFLIATLDAFEEHPDALLAFTDYEEFTFGGPRRNGVNLRIKRYLCNRVFGGRTYIERQQEKKRLLAWGNPISCSSVTINRSAIADFRFDETMGSNLDWQAWMQLAHRQGKFLYIKRALVQRRIHAMSETSVAIADKRRQTEDLQMFKQSWPPLLATLIARIYRFSYQANRV